MGIKVLLCLLCLAPVLGAKLPYIIGGKNVTDATRYPWMCAVTFYGGIALTCGASLISHDWLITAAHCYVTVSSHRVGCGSADFFTLEHRDIAQLIKHEKYNDIDSPGAYPNDIAVIRVASPFTLSDKIRPITMASRDQAGNPDCYITGWGVTSYGAFYDPFYLQEAKINVYTNSKCKESWNNRINDGHVCVGDPENGRGSCKGDSGGPLVCRVDNAYQLVGATSWSMAGCSTRYPSVYTRITYFRDWIKQKSNI